MGDGQRQFHCETEWVDDQTAVVAVSGELDLHTSWELRDTLKGLREDGVGDGLVVDLSDCSFVDSSTLGVLVLTHRQGRRPLNLVVSHPDVLRTLAITGLDQVFALHETREAALHTTLDSSDGSTGSPSG